MKKILVSCNILFSALLMISMLTLPINASSLVWSTPVQLTTPPFHWGHPSILQDSNNKIWVSFHSYDTAEASYMTSTDQGETWSLPQQFPPAQNPPGALLTAELSFFEDSQGRLWAVWGRWNAPSQEDLYYSTSDDHGTTWSESRLVVSYADVDGMPCFVEVDGEIWLVFSSWGIAGNWNIYYVKTFDGGITWSSPQGIAVSPYRHDSCNVLRDSAGKVWIVYTNLTSPYDPATADIWYVKTNDGGTTWSTPRQVTSFPSEEMHPKMVEYKGMFYVFYFDRYNPDVCYVVSDNLGTEWSSVPERIPDPTIDQHWLDASVVDDGIWVVWQSRLAGDWDIWLSKAAPPISWEHVFEDPCRGTVLKISTDDKCFQFIAPQEEFPVKHDPSMRVVQYEYCTCIAMAYEDEEIKLMTYALDGRFDTCVAWAKNTETSNAYLLIDRPGVE